MSNAIQTIDPPGFKACFQNLPSQTFHSIRSPFVMSKSRSPRDLHSQAAGFFLPSL